MLSNFRNNVNSGQPVVDPFNFILDLHCLEFYTVWNSFFDNFLIEISINWTDILGINVLSRSLVNGFGLGKVLGQWCGVGSNVWAM